jgi:hypothetical protein
MNSHHPTLGDAQAAGYSATPAASETLDRLIGETMAMAERLDHGERERQAAHIAFETMGTLSRRPR